MIGPGWCWKFGYRRIVGVLGLTPGADGTWLLSLRGSWCFALAGLGVVLADGHGSLGAKEGGAAIAYVLPRQGG